ncbi:MAG TPA: DUF4212 domain-containing protein [Desulfuromonadales bacterium]|nr:DUF4212 domain-containing protein [Desulfuromonadales bacterium]
MAQPTPSATPEQSDLRVNFFRPRAGFMRREVSVIWLTLLAWALVSVGFPLSLGITADDPAASLSTGRWIFGMPWHYWFSGHFLIVWFIFICAMFNILIDWLTKSYRKRR